MPERRWGRKQTAHEPLSPSTCPTPRPEEAHKASRPSPLEVACSGGWAESTCPQLRPQELPRRNLPSCEAQMGLADGDSQQGSREEAALKALAFSEQVESRSMPKSRKDNAQAKLGWKNSAPVWMQWELFRRFCLRQSDLGLE